MAPVAPLATGLALPETRVKTPRPVRSAPFFAFIALGIAAVAEELPSTPTRGQQLFGPVDQSREFNMKQMFRFGRSKSDFQARDANTNSFYIQQKYQAKGYQTESFRTKSAWDGNFKFSTKDAPRQKSFDTKSAPVKTAAVKDAQMVDKKAATREFAPGNKTSTFKGRNQALFDKEGPAAQAKVGGGSLFREPQSWSGNLKTLTVDDVRDILNKNK
jgi:hypothetical protein